MEFKRVNWPSKERTVRLTLTVIVFSLAVAVFLGVLDLALNRVLVTFILK